MVNTCADDMSRHKRTRHDFRENTCLHLKKIPITRVGIKFYSSNQLISHFIPYFFIIIITIFFFFLIYK